MRKRVIPLFLAVALLISGLLSIVSIHRLQGNARVINYTGVVRGATQRLIKQELSGQPNEALIQRLDGILDELATGQGENGLVRLRDDDFQALVAQMQQAWERMKDEILLVRQGADAQALYDQSEEYFELADRAVSAAEIYSERQIGPVERALLILSIAVLALVALLTWYSAAQERQKRQLRQAEEETRAESERLTRLSEDLRAPMDEISELMYISDVETHELLYINEMGRQSFGITELNGQFCYKVLQGKESPCDFCSTPQLKPGETYTWERTNPITKRHYLLKDRLLEWEGRPARLEIAFDITEAEAEKQALKNMLDGEQMVVECVRTLYQEQDLKRSLPLVLGRLGRFLGAERTYLILVRDGLLYNDFEWCEEGIPSQREILQALPLSVIDFWRSSFDRQECSIVEDVDVLREGYPDAHELLQMQGIHSLVAAPLEQDGCLQGVLGVDNPPPERIKSVSPLLQTLCYFIMLALRRTEAERQLSHLSYYDTLTSFYNRNRYMEDTAALSHSTRAVGIVYLDVNGLKDINDQKGHAVGDQVLITCAQWMREIFQQADYYRIGGDEFVIICPGISREDFEARAAALRRRFHGGKQCRAAIGARWVSQFADLQQIIAQADAEMYEDKKDFYRKNPSSNRYRHHSDEVLRLSDPEVLREELRQERFEVYLQPKISSFDRSAVGAEALVRYRPPSGSLMLPGNFLPLLEESQSISQIDFYVFELACARLKEWAEKGKETFPLAVNFSRCSLAQPDFVERLDALCQQYGVDKKYLEIEITETSRTEDGVDLQALTRALRQAGFVVSIDDFGTEYANLALLSSVEFDVLKLDKSLVDDVARSPKARTVVKSIVRLCKEIGIQVVAEGIETEDQLAALRTCGVELAQGFLFSKAIPIEEYEEKYL